MSELERLRKEYDAAVKRRHGKIGATGLEIRADALITALEAELERLRCCGNCGRFVIDCDDLETYCPNGDGTFTRCYIQDHCHFTPSRWKEAER